MYKDVDRDKSDLAHLRRFLGLEEGGILVCEDGIVFIMSRRCLAAVAFPKARDSEKKQ